ncbi:MAG: hypothetical protein WA002_13075 [Candidatus Acidiferrales bacterium]
MAFRKSSRKNGEASALPQTPRRLTRDLLRAFELAMMMADSRATEVLEIADLLAGMYVDNWDRLARYWPEREEIENDMRRLCRISPQRWNHWIEYYDQIRREPERKWTALGIPMLWRWRNKQEISVGRNFELSTELSAVLRSADEIAPFRDKVGNGTVPIVSSESVLLAMAQNVRSEIGRRLLATGLDVTALEKAARFPKRMPI